ncbi:MAG: DUF2141 domain-containing protein [Flavobacteriaceae bacterium]|nr:DUF2141 domain-containing protein [Flavobacteriaceae bacterium]
MKTILFTLAFMIASLFAQAQNDAMANTEEISEGTTITVTVPVPNDEGTVIIGLYDESTFMRAAPLQGLDVEIVDGKATGTFENVAPGVYGITLFHDKNGNKNMDFEANGMPLEMYGVSNNVMSYGPPQWSDAKFEVANEPLTLDIRM